jgi:hypothetical protein
MQLYHLTWLALAVSLGIVALLAIAAGFARLLRKLLEKR